MAINYTFATMLLLHTATEQGNSTTSEQGCAISKNIRNN